MRLKVGWVGNYTCDNIFFLIVSIYIGEDMFSNSKFEDMNIQLETVFTEFTQILGATLCVMLDIYGRGV